MIVKNAGICANRECTIILQEKVLCTNPNCKYHTQGTHYHCKKCNSPLLTDEKGIIEEANKQIGWIRCPNCDWEGILSECKDSLILDENSTTDAILVCHCPGKCKRGLFGVIFKNGLVSRICPVDTNENGVILHE